MRVVIGCVLLALVPSCSSKDTEAHAKKKKPREARVHDDDRDLDDRDDVRSRPDRDDDRPRDPDDDRRRPRARPVDPDDDPPRPPDPPRRRDDDDAWSRPAPTTRCVSCNPGDCPGWTCECEDGTSSKVRVCINGCCKSKADTCRSSCEKHDGLAGTWDRVARGGDKTGASCGRKGDCASRLCEHGVCTKECETSGDCPPFWTCETGVDIKLCTPR